MTGQRVKKTERLPSFTVEADPLELTESDWANICEAWKASSRENPPLANSARREIIGEIVLYRGKAKSLYTSLRTKRKLESTQVTLKKLKRNLKQLEADETFRFAGRLLSLDYKTDLAELTRLLNALLGAENWLQETRDRLPSSRGRKSSEPLKRFLFGLMRIYAKYSGGQLRRSLKTQPQGKATSSPSNPFVQVCAKIADPKLPRSRIDTALINAISMYHRADRLGQVSW